MAARFLYVWPAPPKYRSILTCRAADNSTAQERLKRIAGIAGTAEHPLILQLSGEAQVCSTSSSRTWACRGPKQ